MSESHSIGIQALGAKGRLYARFPAYNAKFQLSIEDERLKSTATDFHQIEPRWTVEHAWTPQAELTNKSTATRPLPWNSTFVSRELRDDRPPNMCALNVTADHRLLPVMSLTLEAGAPGQSTQTTEPSMIHLRTSSYTSIIEKRRFIPHSRSYHVVQV